MINISGINQTSGDGENWLDLGYILHVELTEYAKELNMGLTERHKNDKDNYQDKNQYSVTWHTGLHDMVLVYFLFQLSLIQLSQSFSHTKILTIYLVCHALSICSLFLECFKSSLNSYSSFKSHLKGHLYDTFHQSCRHDWSHPYLALLFVSGSNSSSIVRVIQVKIYQGLTTFKAL